MPMAVIKLHMASDLGELQKQSAVDSIVKKENKAQQLLKSANTLYKSAIDTINKEVKDEELAYKYLFRAMELWKIIFTTTEFKSDRKFYNLMHGKEVKSIIDLLEEYTEKLTKRYTDLKNGVKESEDSLMTQFRVTPSVACKKRKEGKGDSESKITNGVKNHVIDQLYEEDYNLNLKLDVSQPKNEPDYYGEKKFIQCDELKEQLIASFLDVLVLDIRPKKDYELSQISNVHCVNIPETSINPGLSANKLGEMITNKDEKLLWNQRDQYKQLVLLDWQSQEKDVIPSCPLANLQNILLKWDPSVVYKNKPLILNGGYERWLDMYPTLTTNARIQCPEKPLTSPFIHLSEHNIEYPMNELEEITAPKPKAIPKRAESVTTIIPASVPVIDRSVKPTEKSVKKTDKPEEDVSKVNAQTDIKRNKTTAQEEPMEEDRGPVANEFEDPNASSTPYAASKEKPQEKSPEQVYSPSPPVRPAVPPRLDDNLYPSTPKKSVANKGEGDGGFSTEKLKFDATSRSGGLKRSASSPNINKLTGEELDMTSKSITPLFDRGNKPSPRLDNYSPRAAGTDSIYQPNSEKGRGLTGLKNLGNLCYMNSIMQCISNTAELTKELTRFNAKEETGSRRQIASEVSSLLRTLWQGDTRITSCRVLKSKVGALRQSFSTTEQQDSHEFLTILMDWLHEDLNEYSSIRSLDGADEATGEKSWGEFRRKNNSVVLDLFYGQLKSTVTCNHCQKQSILFEPFSNLSVPLPPPQDNTHDKDRRFSLQDCLKLYLKGETITGWVCPTCKTAREATKKLDITRLPPVLIIHLKRFMSELGVGWCRKRMNMVDFPLNDFDMKAYTHPDSELRFHNYNLYAVSNHYGSMDSGHYTAYCKNHLLNKWYKFDDHDVNEMSPLDVKSSAAYILFYESNQFENNSRILD